MKKFQFLALILFPIIVYGQTGFLYHDIDNIRANEAIKGITRDTAGYIWLATDHGVLRYDGTETRLFFKELQSPFTKKFITTSSGRLLVISDFRIREIKTISDTVSFVPFALNQKTFDQQLKYPKSVYEDKAGNIWIGEYNSVVRINDDGLKRYELGSEFQSISYHRTFSFGEDAFGHLWVAPFKGTLLIFDKEQDDFRRVEVGRLPEEVTGLTVYKGDYIVITGKGGFLKLKVDSANEILEATFYDDLTDISAVSLAGDDIFLGTWNSGLHSLDFSNGSTSRVRDISFNDVVDLYASENELWVAGSEHIGVLKTSPVVSFDPVGDYRVESLTLSNEEIYFSTGNDIRRVNLSSPEEGNTAILESDDNYFDCLKIHGSDLWIGDSFGAIFKYDLNTETLDKIKDSTAATAITSIAVTPDSSVWFTGNQGPLIQIDSSKKLISHGEMTDTYVVGVSPKGDLYCGGQGLFRYNPFLETFDKLALDTTIADLRINDLAFDQKNRLYLATNAGVLSYDIENSKTSTITIDGLMSDEPFKAVAFLDDILWAASSHGLSAVKDDVAVLFTYENGLPSNILKDRGIRVFDKKLFVATAKGLAQLNSNASVFTSSAKPIFRNVLINGSKLVDGVTDIEIPYEGRVQFEFITLAYPGGNVMYQTRVKELDTVWSKPAQNRVVSFIGFSPGSYTLEVRARERGRLWSDARVIKFNVALPWFRRWWAYLLFAVVAVGLVLIISRIYHYNLILQKRRLKKIIEQRTAEINMQKNEIIEQKNRIIQQKEELLEKNKAVHKSQQALSEADVNFLQLKEKQLHDQIDYRNKQITTHTLHIIQKNETLKDLRDRLEKITRSSDKNASGEIKKTVKLIDESFRLDKDWEDFKLYFEQIYTGFYTKLKVSCPALTSQELRHCALIRLNLSISECASILGNSPDSVKVSRARIRKKLDLEHGQGLTDFILSV